MLTVDVKKYKEFCRQALLRSGLEEAPAEAVEETTAESAEGSEEKQDSEE